MPQEGEIRQNRLDPNRTAVFQNGVWVEQPRGKGATQEASMRSRMDLGLAPMVGSHQRMSNTEAKGNPYALDKNGDNAFAKFVGDIGVSVGQNDFYPLEGFAKKVGGQDYQNYEQAAAAFESQLMPIMSGAAVSPSEARRQIKAALPALGDSPETLREKGRTREMMLNGAAKARGLPLPYPNTPTWGVNTTRVPGREGGSATPGVRVYNPQTGRIE